MKKAYIYTHVKKIIIQLKLKNYSFEDENRNQHLKNRKKKCKIINH